MFWPTMLYLSSLHLENKSNLKPKEEYQVSNKKGTTNLLAHILLFLKPIFYFLHHVHPNRLSVQERIKLQR